MQRAQDIVNALEQAVGKLRIAKAMDQSGRNVLFLCTQKQARKLRAIADADFSFSTEKLLAILNGDEDAQTNRKGKKRYENNTIEGGLLDKAGDSGRGDGAKDDGAPLQG